MFKYDESNIRNVSNSAKNCSSLPCQHLYLLQVLLLVNVASECGYTDGHYKELVELQNKYSSRGFTVLAFPCNQFGKQEPKDNKSILKFAKEQYNINFPLFAKIKVGGEDAHPLYIYLYQATSEYPKWNFGKYLVDKLGNVVKFFPQNVSPKECVRFIEKLLNNKSNVHHTDL